MIKLEMDKGEVQRVLDANIIKRVQTPILSTSKDISEKQIDIPLGRSFAYSYVMGFSEGIYREYGELNPKTALKALKDGKGIKDFYSSVLIPVFVVLVCIISALSIYNAVRLNLRDRINNLSILRCIGMSSFTTFMLLFSEIIVLVEVLAAVHIDGNGNRFLHFFRMSRIREIIPYQGRDRIHHHVYR